MDRFSTGTFRQLISLPAELFGICVEVVWRITRTPRRFAFVSLLDWGKLMNNLHFYSDFFI